MAEILITENDYGKNNLLYLKYCLNEIFIRTGAVITEKENGRNDLRITCKDSYQDVLRAEIFDKIAEIIAVKYKYDFFRKTIRVSGLKNSEYEILMASLIAADLEEDKKYCYHKLTGLKDVNVDGFYNFMLCPLKRKWLDITSYMPATFINSQLKDFVTFLLENKKKRAYVDSGKVYDCHFRRLKRTFLLDGDNAKIIREIILSNSGEVEISGSLEPEDEYYLKEFYKDKIYFSHGN